MIDLTKAQKRKIQVLRAKGYGFRRISESTNIAENTVKYFLRITPENKTYINCKNCGKEALCIPGYKKKVFCSDSCRMVWWSKNQKEINHKLFNHICKACGKEFTSFRKDSVVCSKQCTAVLKRKDGGERG